MCLSGHMPLRYHLQLSFTAPFMFHLPNPLKCWRLSRWHFPKASPYETTAGIMWLKITIFPHIHYICITRLLPLKSILFSHHRRCHPFHLRDQHSLPWRYALSALPVMPKWPLMNSSATNKCSLVRHLPTNQAVYVCLLRHGGWLTNFLQQYVCMFYPIQKELLY